MAVLGTFGSFTTATLGIYASQASLNVTGNNIANINTKGYTRQRMDLVSLNSTGTAKYANSFMVDVGYGVLCESTSQLRDPYLDIRFRDQQSNVGFAESKLEGLESIAHFLDEVGKGDDDFGVIADQIHRFFDALQADAQRIGTDEYDSLVRAAADTLTTLFNNSAKSLETVRENEVGKLKDSIVEVNSILNNIRDLNKQIRTQGIYGDMALELRDARNVQIDELSKLMKIDVTYSMEKIDQYTEVEKLTITLADSGNPPIKLVDGIYGAQFTMPEKVPMPNPKYDPTLSSSKQYIGKDGKPTDIAREAAVLRNPLYNSNASELKKYLDEKGNPTNSLRRAALRVNPAYAADNTLPQYMKLKDGVDPATAAFPADYEPTNDKDAAARVPNPDYDPDSIYGKAYLKVPPYEVATDDRADAAMLNTDIEKYGEGKYLKLKDPAADPNDPDSFEATDDVTEAYVKINPDYDPADPAAAPQYLKTVYEATNEAADAAKQLNPKYDPTLPTSSQYLKLVANPANNPPKYPEDYTHTDNPEEAATVPSFSEDLDSNRYLLQLTALRDEKDHFMRDEYGVEIKEEPIEIGDTLLHGSVQAMREMLTEEGEFSSSYDIGLDRNASIKRGIPYYQRVLDNWAQTFADVFNEANQMDPAVVYKTSSNAAADDTSGKGDDGCFLDKDGNHLTITVENADGSTSTQLVTSLKQKLDEDGKPVTDPGTGNPVMIPKEITDYTAAELEALRSNGMLKEEYSFYTGGVLFSNSGDNNDATGITAKNISVAHAWEERSVKVLATKKPNERDVTTGEWIPHTTRQDNILHMVRLIDEKRGFMADRTVEDTDATDDPYFKGTFEEMFTNISGTLAEDQKTTQVEYTTFCTTSLDLDNKRASVSGVDLNEEATHMMQYEKSYAAACRLLTTLDSMLDKLINGTAI